MKNSKSFPFRVLLVLILTTLLLFSVHVILKFVSIVIFDEKHGFLFELSNRFDMNDENSVPQWFSQIIFLSIGVASLLAAHMQREVAKKRLWIAIGILGIILSLDDVATLHEFALQMIHNTFFLDTPPTFSVNAWWILLPIVLIPPLILAWYSWKLLPRRTVVLLILGGTIFVVGKLLLDSLANIVTDLFLERGFIQGFEKVFQYLGSSLVLYAVLDYLQAHHSKRINEALEVIKG